MNHKEILSLPAYATKQYNRQTIQKAIAWLKSQQQELSEHITDVNLIVKLYLKNQEKKPFSNSFKKELASLTEKRQAISNPKNTPSSLSLDTKSKEAIEKASTQLNIPSDEALKVLIQLGDRTLQTLFKSH